MEGFRGTVATVQTAPFWNLEPHRDGGHHYHGSAEFFYTAGEAFGKAMLELLKNQQE
jgi:hypothetical protein